MSADNGYMLKKHPKGGYALVMWFASDDNPCRQATEEDESYPTIQDALKAFSDGQAWLGDGYYPKFYCEYGLSLDPLIFSTIEEAAAAFLEDEKNHNQGDQNG